MLAEVGLVGLVAFSAVVIPSSVPRAMAGPPPCTDTDVDWLCDTAEVPYGDTDADSLPNWNDPDDDGDGIPTILEHADPSDEGDPRDARDRDRDGQPDWLDAPTLPTDGWVSGEQKISDTAGGFAGILNSNDTFHVATAIGDVDGDGVVDLAVGAPGDDDGQANAGAVYVLFLNVNGTVRAEQKISDTDGGLATVLDAGDEFGFAVAGVGDLDGDGIAEVAVGARSDDDGGSGRGAVFVLFLNANGTVRAEQKISDTVGGLAATLSNGGEFGSGVAGLGDLDGDGLPDLGVGARLGDDGGLDRGEVHVLFLNANGTVRAEQKVSDTVGGFVATLDNGANFGHGLAGPGDIDGDGVEDLVVGAPLGDGGGTDRGEVHVLFLNTNGTVRAEQEISATVGGLGGLLRDGDRFGSSVAGLGDLDGDGVADLAIGAAGDDDHGIDKGAVHLVALTASGTVGERWTLSEVDGNFSGSLDDADGFGGAVTGLGDLDGDGDIDLAIGAAGDDDGGTDRGAVYVIDLTPAIDTDGDGLYDYRELPFGDTDGDSLPNWNDPDDDGDGVPTSLEGADPDGDGDPRDARDSDRDGQPDYLDVPTNSTSGTVASEQKISELVGGFATTLTNTDQFGAEVTAIGDLDGDGIVDLAVGANLDNGGGFDRGALYVLFMNADGTVRAEQEISDVQGGLTEVIDDGDYFGRSIGALGDLDGDGIPDLAVGAPFDDDGGTDRGAVHVLFMNSNGTVRDEEKISDIDGDLAAVLDDLDLFGLAVEGIGDLDGDGFPDLAVGVRNDDDGGVDRGAVHVLFMNPDGTVRAEQKISDTQGGLAATLDNSDWFGAAVAALGDLDGDGIGDLVVGARNDDDGGPDTGAAYVLFMNTDGTVRAQQKVSDTVGAVPPMLALDDGDWFGSGLAGLGDLDGDGRPDLAVGAWRSDDGGTDRGALHVLFLNADGTVRDESVISDTQGGLAAALDDGDQFGGSVTGLGDLDGDGTIGIAVGAFLDDDGGADRGAVYVLDLQPPAPVIVNSTGDAGDATPGDGVCWTGANNSEANPACTLRAAIQEANAGVADTIHFDIPPTEAGYNGGTGVWTIAVPTFLPVITSPVEIAAATQTVNRGDTNPGTLGLSRAVGTGPDGVIGSGDELTVDGVAAPEIEVDFGAQGFRIESSGVEISGLAMFGGNADVWIQSGTGAVVADNVIGTRASSFSDPGPAARSTGTGGVAIAGGSDVSIVGNLIGFQSERGLNVFGDAVDVVISGNEIRSTGMAGTDEGGGIELTNFYVVGPALTGVTITGNLVTGSVADFGIEVATDAGDSGIVIRDNTVLGNSVLLYGDQNPDGGMVRHNEIRNADLDGVLVDGVSGWSILGNSITDSATLGIALFSGANDALAAPTIDAALSDGPTIDVDVTVMAPAGTYRVEFFTNTVADPSGFGEGERFVGSTTITHAGGSGAYSTTIASTRRGFLAATLTVDEGAGEFGSTSAFSNSLAVACSDADADGLCDVEEDANSDADGDPTTTPGPDTDGDSLPNYLDADDDGDSIATALENADPNADGDPRDARDRDRDGQPDWLDTEAGPSSTPVASEQKISAISGGLVGPLDDGDELGQDVTGIGDLDGDGIDDLAVGVPLDDDGGTSRGAVYVLFMNADGTVRDEQKISDTAGGFTGVLDDFDEFGHGVATLGDVDGDGVTDIAVGTWNDTDGGPSRGAVWILFLERDGTVKAHQKISDTTGGLLATLDDFDRFGSSSSGLGDLDGDGTPDVIVGAREDDDGGTNRGAAYVLFLNPDGTVRAEQKISDTTGGLTGVLDDFDEFGHDVAGISDLDGDGIDDAAAGSFGDDDGGPNRGAAYVLFLNADGTVRAEQKLSAAAGPLAAALGDEDRFGNALVGIGDIDGNGTPDLAVAASEDDDGALDAGAVHLLRLATDGTIVAADKISATTGGLTGPFDAFDHFGRGIGSLGDLDGDGTLNLAISARYDDDGGPNRGAVYVLDLSSPTTVVVNSTGAAGDATPGDGVCWTGASNSAGDPACTLRAAVQEANAHPTIDTVQFDIPTSDPGHAGGVWTISPATSLPAITAAFVLDATTQPGWIATPVVEIDGSSAGAAVDGITLAAGSGGSEIRGVAIGGFSREGIAIEPGSDGNLIAGNHLGTDASGTVDRGNASSGIYVTSDGNTIGGSTPADRNVISGNDGYGIYFGWTANNTVVGNHIGVDRTGNAPLGNTFNGIFVSGTGHAIGGSAAGEGNVIGDHGDIAIRIESGSGHRVVGNSIGVGADGSTVLGNATGVSVRFGATDVVIGGTAPGEGNTIRNNGKGVLIHDAATDDIAVIGNAISANGGLGIDFEDNGVTANDAGDGDTGANGLLNFPVITAADATGGTVDLEVQLDAPAGSYRIEVFDNPSGVDPSGHGEGEQFVHAFTVVHTGSGPQTFTTSFAGAAGDVLTSTATESLGASVYGSTSEFSAAATACGDADGDGLCDHFEDLFGDTDGDLLVNRLDPDDDGDGVATALENADPNGDGDPRDARDSDRDGQPDHLDAPTTPTDGTVATEQKISGFTGGLVAAPGDSDLLGFSTASIGDLDGDGVVDIAVGAPQDDDGGTDRGAVLVLFLNPDGTVRDEQKISDTSGGLAAVLDDGDQFGWSVAGIGDLDGDGHPDLAVGAARDDDGGSNRGAVHVLFLNPDGTVRDERKISDTNGGLAAVLDDDDNFGGDVAGLGDLDGDGTVDVVVGAYGDDDGGANRGAVHVLFLNPDGTVRDEQKISDTAGGLVAVLDDADLFGRSVTSLGDLDGDGSADLAVGALLDDDGGPNRGAVHVLFLNPDGTVRDEQKISDTQGGFTATLDDVDEFGFGLSGVGDLDGDGTPDLAAAAWLDDDGGPQTGAVYVLFLEPNGAVRAEQKISDTSGDLSTPLDDFDNFGHGIAAIGDLDGDGTIGLAIGAPSDDDGGADRGAVYVLDLSQTSVVIVNSTGDATDVNAGNGVCETATPGECTLRAAIAETNANPALNTIRFAIPGAGPTWNIPLGSQLPVVTAPVVVDATTQPGWSGDPVVVIDGSGAGFADGFNISAGSTEIRGFVIVSFNGDGIDIGTNGGNTIAGNWIGLAADGITIAGVADDGIVANEGANANLIGGPGPNDGNVVSGNASDGILLWSDDNVVQGNFLGTDVTGLLARSNGDDGLDLDTAADTLVVDNVISGNGGDGVQMLTSDGSTLTGNLIGVGSDGTTPLGNVGDGITVNFGASVGVRIGGVGGGDGNTIAHNGDEGVSIFDSLTDDIAVLGNSIHSNAALGIDLLGDGVTPNDANDADGGVNDLFNFPVITSASESAGTVTIDFDLDVPAGTYRIEAFTNPSGADPSGYGEGEAFAGATTVVHTGGGLESFVLAYSGGWGDSVTLTTTEEFGGGTFGSTSEFSRVRCADSDGDGLCDAFEDLYGDTDGDLLVNRLDADDDGDGIPTASENADVNGDGDPRDARDRDRDGEPDWLDVEAGPSWTPVSEEQKISSTVGGFTGTLLDGDRFGGGLDSIGDVDGDGIVDLAVGAELDDGGGPNRGAVHVLFMNADGTVRAGQEISTGVGGLSTVLGDNDRFGADVAGVGDLDGDGVPDLAVGAIADDDGGPGRGAVYVLFLNPDGTVRAEQKISSTSGGLTGPLDDGDSFGGSVGAIGDLDGDGVADLVVGSYNDDDGASSAGAVYVLFVNSNGTVKAEQKISNSSGGLTTTLVAAGRFGIDVDGIGDIDADGVDDLAVGAGDQDAVFVLRMHSDGTVKGEHRIAGGVGGFIGFGYGVAGLGDLDGDGIPDLAVGEIGDDGGGTDRGAVYLLSLNADGTVAAQSKLSAASGGVTGPLDDSDFFGRRIAGLGDLDGDGGLDLAVSADRDDDGGTDRGAVYVLDLAPVVPTNVVIVNSTGDGTDQNPGDGVCHTGSLNSEGDPACTLRAAIEEVNAHPVLDTVHFDIPVSDANHAAGTWTITPTAGSELPAISTPMTLDGSTQPGAIVNTAVAPAPMNGRLAIELSGAADDVTSDWDGLVVEAGAGGSVVRGISFVQWDNATSDAILVWGSSDNVIAGNYFGVRADGGTAAVGNMAGVGIGLGGSDNRVGGTAAGDRNLFAAALAGSGSGWALVWNGAATSIDNVVQGNEMGFTIGGVPTSSDASGVAVIAGEMTVGGIEPSAANRIRGGLNGVMVTDDQGPATVSVLGNRIWGQLDLSIDLDEDSFTLNDPLDIDAGPNALLNHPVITSVDEVDGTARVSYELDVPAGTYRIEFFENVAANLNGSGPGEVLVHVSTVTHPGGGLRSYLAAFPASTIAPIVAATAIEVVGPGQFGATSEFSSPLGTVPAGSPFVDHSGRRADLDALGGADGGAPGAGITGSAIELAGGAERLVTPTFDLTGPALTVSGWVRLDSATGDPRLVSRTSGSTTILDVFVSGTTATARLGIGGSTVEVSGGSVSLATWHQIAATWDGSTLTLFVDGAPVDTSAATGALATDPKAPLVVGNSATRDRGLDGRIDDVRIASVARSADWVQTEYLNLTQPERFVTLGVSQTAAPGAWAATTAEARTGTHSLAAPVTPAGADAWATAQGIDEPGLVVDAWWRLTDPGAARVGTGTATGVVPVDQLETGITFGAVDLATQVGVTRTVDDTAMFGSSFTTWTRVEMRTDELGRSTALVDGTVVAGPTMHSGGPSRGSAGLRASQLTIGQAYVDDIRIRRYVSDEPTATLGPLLRQ